MTWSSANLATNNVAKMTPLVDAIKSVSRFDDVDES